MDLLLSDGLKTTINIALAITKEYGHGELAPAHLLKALLHKDAGLLPLLKKLQKDIYDMEDWAEMRMEMISKSTTHSNTITGNRIVAEVFNEADCIRLNLQKEDIQPEHALAALCTPGVGFTYEQLKSFPLRRDEIIIHIANNEELQCLISKPPVDVEVGQTQQPAQHALLKYCIDKTLLAKEGKLDAITGRQKEIRMMAEILCRRSKPNILIVGEPGVGKSALVDGFANAIVQNNVPQHLLNARIFELNIGSLKAGASYKGEIEDRLKNILKEIKQFERAILFIDEIHALVDTNGSAASSADLLKPELAGGEITVIGATTLDEYRKHIEKDEAFNRRFELLTVHEPDGETCFQMIKAIIPYYENYHGITVPDDSIYETIRFSKRYIKDRRLPDAAIDLADRSMAALRIINDSGSKDIAVLKTKYEEWCHEDETASHGLPDWQWFCREVNQQISPILWCAIQSEDDPANMEQASDVKKYLYQALNILEVAASHERKYLEKSDIAAIISFKTGIPIGKVQAQERERLLNMECILKQRVIGQDHAIKAISEAVLECRAGLSKPGQPIGSFFFLGPTGTGKTELAKSLAEFLFQDESCIIRFDMSEFKDEHSTSFLLGAAPGLVGHPEGGKLVNMIRQKPYSVVLFDEIEKAHPSIFDIFLQIMDEGKLHDKLGKEGDFSNALIIFTSNIGSQYVVDKFNQNQLPVPDKLMEVMAQYFRPEFLGRLTEIIPFAPINEKMIASILNIQLKSLYHLLAKQGIKLKLTETAIEQLGYLGYSPLFGARPLAGIIRSRLRRPLSAKIINGELCAGNTISLKHDEDGSFEWLIENTDDNDSLQCLVPSRHNVQV